MEEICSVCNNKISNHSDNIKKELTSRINRISGQLSGIIRMISDNVYCDDVLNQLSSVISALNGTKKFYLKRI